jgi:hypothetical protein
MDDGENTGHSNQESNSDTQQPLSAAVSPSTSNSEQPHSDLVHSAPDSNPEEHQRWFRNPDWWMVILTALILAATIGTAIIFYRQFKEMATQTGLLNTQAQQAVRDSIEAAARVEDNLRSQRGR